MSVIVVYGIPLDQVDAVLQRGKADTEARLVEARDKILDFIEQYQIKSYTANSNPALPPGSNYQRTFNLAGASEIEKISGKLPNISGVWRVDENRADYAEHVLGTRQQQAKIHRGRWKSLEEVERAAQEKGSQIVQEQLSK